MTSKSYECHITIDPVFDERREAVEKLSASFSFKLAKLVMIKEGRTLENDKDTFMTGHAVSLRGLKTRMKLLCLALIQAGFVVRRYKIEEILIDSRTNDYLRILEK